jgi:hypothetical protein
MTGYCAMTGVEDRNRKLNKNRKERVLFITGSDPLALKQVFNIKSRGGFCQEERHCRIQRDEAKNG